MEGLQIPHNCIWRAHSMGNGGRRRAARVTSGRSCSATQDHLLPPTPTPGGAQKGEVLPGNLGISSTAQTRGCWIKAGRGQSSPPLLSVWGSCFPPSFPTSHPDKRRPPFAGFG